MSEHEKSINEPKRALMLKLEDTIYIYIHIYFSPLKNRRFGAAQTLPTLDIKPRPT